MDYIIKDRLDELIVKGIVAYGSENDKAIRDSIRLKLELHRSIKNEFTKKEKERGKEMTPDEELNILLKMKTQREDSWQQYRNAGRWDLANKENVEAELLSHIIPAQPTDEDIELYTEGIIQMQYDGKCTMKDIKVILAEVKKKYPAASGSVISNVVKKHI